MALARYLGLFLSPEALAQEVKDRSDDDHLYDLNQLREILPTQDVIQVHATLKGPLRRCLLCLTDWALSSGETSLLPTTLNTLCEIVQTFKAQGADLSFMVDFVPTLLNRVNSLDESLAAKVLQLVELIFAEVPANYDMNDFPNVEGYIDRLQPMNKLRVMCRSEPTPAIMQTYEDLVTQHLHTDDVTLACAVLKNWIQRTAGDQARHLMTEYVQRLTNIFSPLPQNRRSEMIRHRDSLFLQVIEAFTLRDAEGVLQSLTDEDLHTLARLRYCREGGKHAWRILTEMLRSCGAAAIKRLKDQGVVTSLLPSLSENTPLNKELVTAAMKNCLRPELLEWFVPDVVISDLKSFFKVHHSDVLDILNSYMLCLRIAWKSITDPAMAAQLESMLRENRLNLDLLEKAETHIILDATVLFVETS